MVIRDISKQIINKQRARKGKIFARCSLVLVRGLYTVTILDHQALNVCWSLLDCKMIPIFIIVPVLTVLHKKNRGKFIANS